MEWDNIDELPPIEDPEPPPPWALEDESVDLVPTGPKEPPRKKARVDDGPRRRAREGDPVPTDPPRPPSPEPRPLIVCPVVDEDEGDGGLELVPKAPAPAPVPPPPHPEPRPKARQKRDLADTWVKSVGDVLVRYEGTYALPGDRNPAMLNWIMKCPRHPPPCCKKRHVNEKHQASKGRIEPLSFLHSWIALDPLPGKTHASCNPKQEDVDNFADAHKDVLEDVAGRAIAKSNAS